MIRRLAVITCWLLAGHAVWLAIFWGLLQVPESSVWTLALSIVLALCLIALAASLSAGAAMAWNVWRPALPSLVGGVRRLPAALAAALLFGALWWLTGRLFDWHAGIAGQIDAWYIARTGTPNTRWIHVTIFWLTMFVRWSLGLTLAVSLLGVMVQAGGRGLTSTSWLRSAVVPARWLAVTFWFVLLIAIPWEIVDWRPATLSLGAEPWFVGAKLSAIVVAIAVGWALVLRVGYIATESLATEAQRP